MTVCQYDCSADTSCGTCDAVNSITQCDACDTGMLVMKNPYIAAEEVCLPGETYECCVTVCEAPNYVETYVTPIRRSLLNVDEDYCVMGACDVSCDTCTLRDDATKCTACPGVEMAVHASYTEDYFSCAADCSALTDYFMYDTDHCADDGCPEDVGIYMIDDVYANWDYLNCDVPVDVDEDNCLAFDLVGDGEYEDFIALCFPLLAECEAFLTAGEADLPEQFTYPCGEFPEEPEDDDDDEEDDDDEDDDDFSFKPFNTILALAALLAL